MVYIDKAIAISIAGDNQGAAALYDQAIAILESLVHKEGRREKLNDLACALACALANRGQTLIALGETADGLEDLRSAQRILRAEAARTGQAELEHDLAWVEQQLAKHSAAQCSANRKPEA